VEEVRVPLTVSPRHTRRGSLALALLALAGLVIPGTVLAVKPPPPPPVNIQILNVSDWHGNLDPVSTAGGAWNLSARWNADQAGFSGPTLRLTAGDDFGATPPLSGFFNEVPAVLAERMMGIQINTFGNHDFDRGLTHLQSMIDLAGAPTDADHPGAPFRYVATNLQNLSGNLTGVDPIAYFNLGGAKVAVIGIVNEEAPTLVSVGNFGTMVVTDGVAATKKFATIARKAGANAVIVITHKGFTNLSPQQGELVSFANALPAGLVDVVIGDHTNLQGSGTTGNGVLFHENLSYGNSYAKTLLTVQPGRGGGVTAKSVSFVTPTTGGLSSNNTSCGSLTYCDQAIVDMLVPWRTQLAAALDGLIGTTTLPFDRGNNIERRQELPLGDLLADGLVEQYGVQIGYYTGGSIRSQFPACSYKPVNTSLQRANYDNTVNHPQTSHTTIIGCTNYAYTPGTPLDLAVGDVYTVLPFKNNIVTRTVTGAQLWQVLENGVSKCPTNYDPNNDDQTCAGRFPQVSGIKFAFDKSAASGCSGSETGTITWACDTSGAAGTHRILWVTLADGTPIPQDSTTYTFATTDFTNGGGDSYFMLADGTATTRNGDANSFLAYLQDLGGVLDPSSYPLDRITICPCS
jgi:5'-nucleotidase